jgi:hypothetical protein
MSELKKLTDEELSSVRVLREEIVGVISLVGQLKLTHDLMNEDLTSVKSKLDEEVVKYKALLVKEKGLVDDLLKKYGMGSLDVETGVFTPEQ